jgi:hypothetical protein
MLMLAVRMNHCILGSSSGDAMLPSIANYEASLTHVQDVVQVYVVLFTYLHELVKPSLNYCYHCA